MNEKISRAARETPKCQHRGLLPNHHHHPLPRRRVPDSRTPSVPSMQRITSPVVQNLALRTTLLSQQDEFLLRAFEQDPDAKVRTLTLLSIFSNAVLSPPLILAETFRSLHCAFPGCPFPKSAVSSQSFSSNDPWRISQPHPQRRPRSICQPPLRNKVQTREDACTRSGCSVFNGVQNARPYLRYPTTIEPSTASASPHEPPLSL